MWRSPIERLQVRQSGRRFPTASEPPLAAASTCPHSKSCWDTARPQQKQGPMPLSAPFHWFHTARRTAEGSAVRFRRLAGGRDACDACADASLRRPEEEEEEEARPSAR